MRISDGSSDVCSSDRVEACLKQKVRRLVHLSSPSIYFDGRDHLDLTEEQVPKRFKHPYAATKYLAEQKVFGAQEFGLEVLALRPRFVTDRKRTRLNSSHYCASRMPSSA